MLFMLMRMLVMVPLQEIRDAGIPTISVPLPWTYPSVFRKPSLVDRALIQPWHEIAGRLGCSTSRIVACK